MRALALPVAIYATLLGAVYCGQGRLIFHPTPLAADHRFALGDDVHEVTIDVPGAQLSALHLKLPAPHGVVVFLHGNAGNLDSWFTNTAAWRKANWDLFMIDYRGFGKSTGTIQSEAQLRADVRAAWDYIAPQYDGKPRVIYGRSLGTALAAGLAADVEPDLTVLVSPYRSMVALGAEHYPWVPAILSRYPLRTEDDAARITGPLLILHGDADTLIPIAHAEAIHARAPQSELVRLPGAGHDDVHEHPAYRTALLGALSSAAGQPSGVKASTSSCYDPLFDLQVDGTATSSRNSFVPDGDRSRIRLAKPSPTR